MEGVRVYDAAEWEAAGLDGVALAERDLKASLEGLARHLFGMGGFGGFQPCWGCVLGAMCWY